MNDYIIQLDIKDNNEIKMKAKNFEEAWNKSQELIKNEYPMMYV